MSGRTVVISGASRGIGAQVLHRLTDAGDRCLVVGLTRPAKCDAFVQADLSDVGSATAATEEMGKVLSEWGTGADILINNAGGADPRTAEELTAHSIMADLTLNLAAPMLLARAVLPGMRAAGDGSIVNVASTAGRIGVAYLHAYSAAKAGLVAFTQSLASECARDGIRVNCVCPGAVDTETTVAGRRELSRLHGMDPEAYQRGMAARTGLGRLLDPGEIADAVVWLAKYAGAAVNGQTLNICGTLTMG